jgi:hypothetical protein
MGKSIEKTREISDDDVLQLTSLDNPWIMKSQTLTILIQCYFFLSNKFANYACCFVNML